MAINAALQKHVNFTSAGSPATVGVTEQAFLLPRGSEPSQVALAMPGGMSMHTGGHSYIAVNPLSSQASTVPIFTQNLASAGAQMLSPQTLALPHMTTTDLQQSSLVQLAPVGFQGTTSTGGSGLADASSVHSYVTG